jgi:hypothetical protein
MFYEIYVILVQPRPHNIPEKDVLQNSFDDNLLLYKK